MTPCPGNSWAASGSVAFAAAATALASGCLLASASEPASASSSGVKSSRLARLGCGSVSVPVLSKTIVSTSASRSRPSPELSITPWRNIALAATTCTAGTARPSAQGQVMISTVMAITSAGCHDRPSSSQPMKVVSAVRWTTGV